MTDTQHEHIYPDVDTRRQVVVLIASGGYDRLREWVGDRDALEVALTTIALELTDISMKLDALTGCSTYSSRSPRPNA
jgi:hypothetical protein